MTRVIRSAAVVLSAFALALSGLALAGAANAAPAQPMATENGCISGPSNGNCNGVWIDEGGACFASSYIVQPNNGGKYFYSQNGYTFETDLRYSTACKSNFSVTTLTQPGTGVYQFSGKVRRAAGPDGPYLMEHGGTYTAYPWSGGAVVISPLVYSPNNQAQACFANNSNDQVGCTSLL
jgi:hypothetical protein